MEQLQSIIDLLSKDNSNIDLSSLTVLRENKEKVILLLIERLNTFYSNITMYENSDNPNYYLFPLLLLSEFNAKEAFPIILKIFSLNHQKAYYLFDNFINRELSSILYHTYNGDYIALEKYFSQKSLDDTCHYRALMTYFRLGSENKVPKESLEKYVYHYIKRIEDNREPKENEIELITEIAVFISENHLFSMFELLRKIVYSPFYDESIYGSYEKLIDAMFSYEDVGKVTNIKNKHLFENRAYINRMYEFPKDFIYDEEKNLSKEYLDKEQMKKDMLQNYYNHTVIKKPDNITKNDLCFCGSGKKYKHCCMNVRDEIVIKTRLEDFYDLLIDYPNTYIDKNEKKGLKYLFSEEAIAIDKLFYKALHQRKIPSGYPRNLEQEAIDKGGYLLDGLDLAYELILRVNSQSIEEFEKKYMIHYRLVDAINCALKIVNDENLPQPQFNHRVQNIVFNLNRYFNN